MANKKLNKNMYKDPASGVWYFQKKVRGIHKPYKFSLETKSVTEARRKRDEYLLEIAVHGMIQKQQGKLDASKPYNCLGEVAIDWAKLKSRQVDYE